MKTSHQKLLSILLVLAVLLPVTAFQSLAARPVTIYGVDRVSKLSDLQWLATNHVNLVITDVYTSGSVADWQALDTAITNANMELVIWPNQGQDYPGCSWENPFIPKNGDYLVKARPMLTWWKDKARGVVIAHEPQRQESCPDSISDMAAITTQIHTEFPGLEVWNYSDNVIEIRNIPGYTGTADFDRIADVHVTWQHCAGGSESPCTGSGSTLEKIKKDRAALDNAGSQAKLVFLQQTFTTGYGYGTKFTLSQLQDYSRQFIQTGALDGFIYYTWDAWWNDLHQWTELHPAIPFIYDNYIAGIETSTPAPPTVTRTPTKTVAPVTLTLTKTRTPTLPAITRTPTRTLVPVTVTPTITLTPWPSVVCRTYEDEKYLITICEK